jgi:hypothetical protein
MASAWTENGPISLPSRPLVALAAIGVVAFAVMGAGMGFQAASRRGPAPEPGAARAAGKDDALIARPIVDLAPPMAAPSTARDRSDDDADDEEAKAAALAAQTAAAQAIQAKPSAAAGDIDDVLASPTEKPPAAVKAPDDATPAPPVKSDVPF